MRSVNEVRDLVALTKKELLRRYGKKIKKVLIYGSFARGEATDKSDVDVLVVVDDSLDLYGVRKSLNNFLFNLLLEKGELISVIAVPESEYLGYNSPFLMNVRAQAVPV